MTQMEQTYLPALCQTLIGVEESEERGNLCRDFREIVESIVLLASPLSPSSLSRVLDIPIEKIYYYLRPLNSVLLVPSNPNGSITLFHLPFRGFLVEKNPCDRARPFAITESTSHRYMTDKCLGLL